jgi:hypothetical protein
MFSDDHNFIVTDFKIPVLKVYHSECDTVIQSRSDAVNGRIPLILEFPGEFIGIGVWMIIVIDSENLDHSGNNVIRFPLVGFRILILEFVAQYTEIHDVTKIIILFLTEGDLVGKPAGGLEVISSSRNDRWRCYGIDLNRRCIVGPYKWNTFHMVFG